MTQEFEPADLGRIRTYSVKERPHKVHLAQLAQCPPAGASAEALLASMPDFLGVRELRAVVDAVVAAVRGQRPVVAAMGAHVVKVGCAPIIIDLMERGVLRALAFHGATAVHDVELAILGATSEEVADTIRDGTFGMVEETLEFFAEAVREGAGTDNGFGAVLGQRLVAMDAPHRATSLLARAHELQVPVTVHVAMGTDTVHVNDQLDAAALGTLTMRDFRLLAGIVGQLGAAGDSRAIPSDQPGGVWLNIGSAVILPEIFLKAVSVARNLGADLDAMVTANFDMIRHYRPRANVVTRPVQPGMGHEIIGHHEILLPLFRQAIVERLQDA